MNLHALVAVHGHLLIACDSAYSVRRALDAWELRGALTALRCLGSALVAAEQVCKLIEGEDTSARDARLLLRRTREAAGPALARAWIWFPEIVDRILSEMDSACHPPG